MWLRITRVWLPLGLAVIGIVMMVLGHGDYKSLLANRNSILSGLGMGMELLALCVALLNWFVRLTLTSDVDRESEEWAREFLVEHGHWPSDSELRTHRQAGADVIGEGPGMRQRGF